MSQVELLQNLLHTNFLSPLNYLTCKTIRKQIRKKKIYDPIILIQLKQVYLFHCTETHSPALSQKPICSLFSVSHHFL